MRKLLTLLALFFLKSQAYSQVVSTIPLFPRDTDSVTILFNASQGNSALAGVSGPIFMHGGVVTNLSATPTSWRYTRGTWGTNDSTVRMDSVAPNIWRKRYHLRNFYGVPASETILKLSFVFRNTNGSIVGRSSDGTDIFVPVYQTGQLGVRILQPDTKPPVVGLNANIAVLAAASDSCELKVYRDNVLQNTVQNDSVQYAVTANAVGKHWIKVVGTLNNQTVADSFYYVVRPAINVAAVPAGMQDGINYQNDSTLTLVLFAPLKQYVYVIGDFNNWEVDNAYFMNRTPDSSRYWVQINNLVPGKQYIYQYFIDGNLKVGDPYGEKTSDPWNDSYINAATYPNMLTYPTGKTTGIATVFQTAKPAYSWQNTSFVRPDKQKLVVYELLVRDFVTSRTYKTVMDSLNYLKNLGINCIHIMPIMEFEGNDSWGYNPSFFMAPDKAYGTENALKALIDSCHGKGIAIVLDMVLNHAFGQNPYVQMWWDAANNRPAANSPFFNPIPKHDFNVGYDFNHESQATKYYVDRILRHWLVNYKFDGFRFDLSKGFTQNNTLGNTAAWGNYDQSRVNIWKSIYDSIQTYTPGAYVILEHLGDNSEETVLANYGMMPWGKMTDNYNQATMGYASNADLTWGSWKARGWAQPNLLSYMESHDEERLMYKNITFGNQNANYSTRTLATALERMALGATHFFTIPGPKLMWQFGELGYDVSINTNGRTGSKPIRWNYLNDANRLRLFKIYKALINLKISESVFNTNTYTTYLGGELKSMNLVNSWMDVVVMGNFKIISDTHIANFTKSGTWYEFFTGDSITVNAGNNSFTFQPGEYRIYTTRRLTKPDLSTGIYDYKWDNTAQLFGNYPNPFSENTLIEYSVDEDVKVSLNIYNMHGQRVRTLLQKVQPAGHYYENWDGSDDAGNLLPAGIYTYELRAGNRYANKKLIIAR